ncbi:MAG: hypothetical protein ACI4FY_09325 [Acetatifactor sp.]
MAYPKPLSEKTLSRMYSEAKLSEEKKQFLHRFFRAAVNLYGSVETGVLWEVYKTLSEKVSVAKITKKELLAFSGIVRREEVPYYVFEIDEIYCEEKRKDTERFLVTRELVHDGYARFNILWKLHELQLEKPPYVPANFLDYANEIMTKEQEDLLVFLGNLKVSAAEYTYRSGKTYPCGPVGECLKDFEFLHSHERFEVKYLSGEIKDGPKRNEKRLAAFLEKCKGPIAARIYRDYIWNLKSGWLEPQRNMEYLLENLEEVGVQLSEADLKELINLLNMTQNTTNLWCNMGWTPSELTGNMFAQGNCAPVIKLGPGIQKAISEGKIDREELIRMLEERGIEWVF